MIILGERRWESNPHEYLTCSYRMCLLADLHAHIMVGQIGIEPIQHNVLDLQSSVTLQLHRYPNIIPILYYLMFVHVQSLNHLSLFNESITISSYISI